MTEKCCQTGATTLKSTKSCKIFICIFTQWGWSFDVNSLFIVYPTKKLNKVRNKTWNNAFHQSIISKYDIFIAWLRHILLMYNCKEDKWTKEELLADQNSLCISHLRNSFCYAFTVIFCRKMFIALAVNPIDNWHKIPHKTWNFTFQ